MNQHTESNSISRDPEALEKRAEALALRMAIEGLINAKLHDAIGRPDGLLRLLAHRTNGIASADVRSAERQLDEALSSKPFMAPCGSTRPNHPARRLIRPRRDRNDA